MDVSCGSRGTAAREGQRRQPQYPRRLEADPAPGPWSHREVGITVWLPSHLIDALAALRTASREAQLDPQQVPRPGSHWPGREGPYSGLFSVSLANGPGEEANTTSVKFTAEVIREGGVSAGR